MKYLLSFLYLLTNLFAHGTAENHPHFFTALHIEQFTLLIVGLIAVVSLYKYMNRESN